MHSAVEVQAVIVSAGGAKRLIRISDVREILALMMPVSVGSSGLCRGMANVRGDIVPLFDLSGPNAPLSPSRFVLLSRVDDSPIGLVVDEIHDVVSIHEADLVRRPTGDGHVSVARIGDELLVVLEPGEVFRVQR